MAYKKLNICIIGKNEPAYSETFIKAHIKNLPGKITFLYGKSFPIKKENGKRLLKIRHKIIKLCSIALGMNPEFAEEIALGNYLKKHKIDVVLAEYGYTGMTVFNICEKCKVPLVVHFHGLDAYTDIFNKAKRSQYDKMFKKASAIIVVSKHMFEHLKRYGVPERKLFYNIYGVDFNKFKKTLPSKNDPILISVGRFVDKKAPYLTILSFNRALKSVPEAKLKMIGDGLLLETCKRLVESLRISKNVEFLPPLAHSNIAKYMKKSRAFVQHSVTTSNGDSEGTPVAILEASITGLPVIATHHAGIPDIIEDEKSGFLVREGDYKKMGLQMIKVLKDPKLADELGGYGRKQNLYRLNMKKSIENLNRILVSVVRDNKN